MANNDDDDNDYHYEDDNSDDEAPDLIEVLAPDAVVIHENSTTSSAPAVTSNNTRTTLTGKSDDHNNIIDETTTTAACPVTILSGFLGSGKTTLIQYILKSPDHGRRIAVIENEFGEGLAIESLIARDGIDDDGTSGRPSLQDLIELPNGCVCCTVKDSLVETLENLITKRADLDYILIEASGMADPGPIASVFWLDDALESRLRLDGIVTLVDGKHILGQLEETEEAARQIAYADRIVLNKVDLLQGGEGHQQQYQHQQQLQQLQQSAAARARTKATNTKTATTSSVFEVERALRSIHPTAPILKTSFSQIPNLDWILDADCFSGFENLKEVQTGFETAENGSSETDHHDHDGHHDHHDHHDDHDHGHQHDDENDDHDCSECCHGENATDADHNHHHHKHHQHHQHEHKHTASITTIALEHPGSVDVRKLNAWLADILWPNQDETDTVLTALLKSQEKDNNVTETTEGSTVVVAAAAAAPASNETEITPLGHVSKNKHNNKTDDDNNNTEQQIFRMKGIVSILSCEDYFEEPTTTSAEGGDDLATTTSKEEADGVGVADVALDERRFIVQAVYDLWDIQPVTSKDLYWDRDEERTGKIVVIGKFLEEETLRAGFYACFD
jgi:G3E family GTPase